MTSSKTHVENYVPPKIHNARNKSCIAGRREIYVRLMFTTTEKILNSSITKKKKNEYKKLVLTWWFAGLFCQGKTVGKTMLNAINKL